MPGPVVPNQALLNGINPLAYMGVRPTSPNLFLVETRDPLTTDRNYALGTWWMNNQSPYNLWRLANLNAGVALWIMVNAGAGSVNFLTSNSGGPVPPLAGNINVVGDGVTITGVGNPATNTITFSLIGGQAAVDSLTGNSGGAVFPAANGNINILGGNNITVVGNPGANTLTASVTGTTNHSVQLGNASGSLTSLANGTTGQILSAQTGSDPIWASPAAPLAASNSFFAYVPTDILNWIGGTAIQTVPNSATLFNNGGFYNTGTFTYTCPVTGLYCFQMTMGLRLFEATSTALSFYLVTSAVGQNYVYNNFAPFAMATDDGNEAFVMNAFYFIQLTAGDTVTPEVNLIGTQAVNITLLGHIANFYRNTFSGFRVV